MDKLNHFLLSQPLAVDNAISTIAVIHKIKNQINDIIDFINNFETHANEYTDEQITLLKNELQIKFNEVETSISNLTNRIDIVDSQIEGIYSELTTLRNIMNTNFSNINNHINEINTSLTLQIQDNYITLYHYINSQIDMIEQLINTQNPEIIDCFGNKNKLQVAYNNLIDALMYSNGGGTFEKVLNKIKTFSFSTLFDMQNVSYYSFCMAMVNRPTSKRVSYYPTYSFTNLLLYTQNLISFKDLVTNINACAVMIYKYGMYVGVNPSDLQTAIRNSFFVINQYESVTLNPTLSEELR